MKLKTLVLLVLTLWTGVVNTASNGQNNTPALLPHISGSEYISMNQELKQLKAQNARLQASIARLEEEQANLQLELDNLQAILNEGDSDDDNNPYLTHSDDINRSSVSSMGSTPGTTPVTSGSVRRLSSKHDPLQEIAEDDVFQDANADQKLESSATLADPIKRKKNAAPSVKDLRKRFEQTQTPSTKGADSDEADDDDDDN